MPTALYTLSYDDFAYYYKAFCEETGKFIPVSISKQWLTTLGQWQINLHALYEAIVRHSCIQTDASYDRWEAVLADISATGAAAAIAATAAPVNSVVGNPNSSQTLTVAQIEQLFLQHLQGFPDYLDTLVQQYYVATRSKQLLQQQQHRQAALAAAQQQQQLQRRAKAHQALVPSYMQLPAGSTAGIWQARSVTTQQQQQQRRSTPPAAAATAAARGAPTAAQSIMVSGLLASAGGSGKQYANILAPPATAAVVGQNAQDRPVAMLSTPQQQQQQQHRRRLEQQQQYRLASKVSNSNQSAAAAAAERMLIRAGAGRQAAAAAAAAVALAETSNASKHMPPAPAAATVAVNSSSYRDSPGPTGSGSTVAAAAPAAAAAAAAPAAEKRGRGRPPKSGAAVRFNPRTVSVEDPVPGNVLQSIVTWLRTASLELAGPLAEQTKVTNKHKVLADRYSTFVDRIQAYRRVPFPENLYARFGVKQARRSGRLRTQAAFFDPGLYSEIESEEDGNPWHIQTGAKHQARLPVLQQQRPAQPTAAEAKFLAAPIHLPAAAAAATGSQQQQQRQGSKLQWQVPHGDPAVNAALQAVQQRAASLKQQGLASAAAGGSSSTSAAAAAAAEFKRQYLAASGDQRRDLLRHQIDKMDQQLGPEVVESLGLSHLGSKLRSTWQPHEEVLFALGMMDKYRKFAYISRRYLPKRSVHELNGYYYNVWKNNACALPEEYGQAATNITNLYAFRYKLCADLVKVWDVEKLGPIPSAAQLPADPLLPAAAAAAEPGSSSGTAAVSAIATANRVVGALVGKNGRGSGRVSRTPTPPPLAAAAAAAGAAAAAAAKKTVASAVNAAAVAGGSSKTRGQLSAQPPPSTSAAAAATLAAAAAQGVSSKVAPANGLAPVAAAAATSSRSAAAAGTPAVSGASSSSTSFQQQQQQSDIIPTGQGADSKGQVLGQQQQQQQRGSSRIDDPAAAAAAVEAIPGVKAVLARGTVSRTEARRLAAVAAAAQQAADKCMQHHNARRSGSSSSSMAAAAAVEIPDLLHYLKDLARDPESGAEQNLVWHAPEYPKIQQQQQQLAAARIALLRCAGAVTLSRELTVVAEVAKKGGVAGVSAVGSILGKRAGRN